MIVKEAIVMLANAELKQLSLADDELTVIGFINLGVTELHKRFPLIRKYVTLTASEDTLVYTLDGTDDNVPVDFSDHELMKIERIVKDTDDEEDPLFEDTQDLVLNSSTKKASALTPTYNEIRFQEQPEAGTTYTVQYRAAPSYLLKETDTIPLPPQFMEALFHYVGYRGHGSVNGSLNAENTSHYTRFDNSCKRLERQGLGVTSDLESNKFQQRGFV